VTTARNLKMTLTINEKIALDILHAEKKGFDEAINRVLKLCSEQANDYARIRKELSEKHRESLPFHYKALAIIDFKLYLEQLFQMEVSINDR
jgi:hypothetical protein